MTYEDWKKQQDELDKLYPGRKRGVWRADYKSMAFTLCLLIGGMAACVWAYHHNFDWLF